MKEISMATVAVGGMVTFALLLIFGNESAWVGAIVTLVFALLVLILIGSTQR
jgi:hypothetical protein